MDGKELVKQLLSRKFAVATIGIIALCYIASVAPGQLAVDENSVVSIVPMPKVPAAEQLDWKIPLYITIITIVTVGIQGVLDYNKQRDSDAIKLNEEIPETKPENSQ